MKTLFYRLQKFFGVDLAYVARGGFWLGVDQAAAIIISLALTVSFANLLSQQIYGTYRYILSIFGILTIFTLPNMDIAVAAAVSKKLEGSLFRALKERIRWGFVGAAASLLLSGYYFFNQDQTLGAAFLIVAAFLPFTDAFNLYGAVLKGKKLFKLKSQYSVIIRAVSALALVATLLLTSNPLLILLAFFVPYVFLRVGFFLLTIRKIPLNDSEDPRTIAYGKHLSAIQFLGALVNYLDNMLIFHYLGAAPLAVYAIAMAPITKVQQAFSVIPELAMPKFSARPLSETKAFLIKKILKALIFTAAGVGAYFLIAPPVFNLFFPKYFESVFYSQLLSLLLLALPFSLIYTMFQSQALKSHLYRYNIAIRVFQLVLVIILVPLYGIVGAIFARIIFQVFSVAVLLVLFRSAK
ncbi:MAG: hypothetical protein AAB560_03665 [Patescibacteria group bacterium]